MAGDTSNTLLDSYQPYKPPAPATCPNCGYCPHCGRGTVYPVPVYPMYPQPYQPNPNPWYIPQITYTCGPTVSSASARC